MLKIEKPLYQTMYADSYIEYLFLKRILGPVALPAIANFIVPQFPVKVEGKTYKIDFGIVGSQEKRGDQEKKYAIELDGYSFHSNLHTFNNDRNRANNLVADGWQILRFTYQDVTLHPEKSIRQLRKVFQKDSLLRYYLLEEWDIPSYEKPKPNIWDELAPQYITRPRLDTKEARANRDIAFLEIKKVGHAAAENRRLQYPSLLKAEVERLASEQKKEREEQLACEQLEIARQEKEQAERQARYVQEVQERLAQKAQEAAEQNRLAREAAERDRRTREEQQRLHEIRMAQIEAENIALNKAWLAQQQANLAKEAATKAIRERFWNNVTEEQNNKDPLFNGKPSFFKQLRSLDGYPTLIVVSVIVILLIIFMFFLLPALIWQQPTSPRPVRPATAAPASTSTPVRSNSPSPGNALLDELKAQPCRVGQIKGSQSKIYHLPDQEFYSETKVSVTCFNSEAEAQAAGFRKSKT